MTTNDTQTAAADGSVERPVRPVAWLREQRGAFEGSQTLDPLFVLGDYMPRNFLNGATYEALYDQAALQNARQAIYEAEAAQLTAPLRARIAELEASEEGAKVAFGHVVEKKQAAEKECMRLQGLLAAAYADIRRAAQRA